MNKLESLIFYSLIDAAEKYSKMTNGHWLSHAPESFIQIYVSCTLAEKDFYVYPDISVGRIREELGLNSDNIEESILRFRCDISVWFKKKPELRASIEIKKTWNLSHIKSDVEKLKRINSIEGSNSKGYIIGYSESKNKNDSDTLSKKFKNWANKSNCILLKHHVMPDKDIKSGYNSWGFCILKVL